MPIVVGFYLALAISSAAYAARSLSLDGVAAAVGLGTTVYAFGGWRSAVLLIVFFVTSSLLGRILRSRRPAVDDKYAKGTRRDWGQVLGNGLIAGVFAICVSWQPDAAWPWLGVAGSIAAVTADTWSTELGVLARGQPRLVTHLSRRVPAGTSGGVSLAGTLCGLLGALLIAALAWVLAPAPEWQIVPAVVIAGAIGSLVDSLLGATVQAMYRCEREGTETEQHPLHRCGSRTVHSRGLPWLGNDAVNLLCAASGSGAAIALAFLAGGL